MRSQMSSTPSDIKSSQLSLLIRSPAFKEDLLSVQSPTKIRPSYSGPPTTPTMPMLELSMIKSSRSLNSSSSLRRILLLQVLNSDQSEFNLPLEIEMRVGLISLIYLI